MSEMNIGVRNALAEYTCWYRMPEQIKGRHASDPGIGVPIVTLCAPSVNGRTLIARASRRGHRGSDIEFSPSSTCGLNCRSPAGRSQHADNFRGAQILSTL